jgi:hypothetical protein
MPQPARSGTTPSRRQAGIARVAPVLRRLAEMARPLALAVLVVGVGTSAGRAAAQGPSGPPGAATAVATANQVPPSAGVPAQLAADNRVSFGIEPASATGPDGRQDFSLGADPGGVLFDDVAVVNYSDAPLQLQIYSTDAVQDANGGFGLLAVDKAPKGVGAWITLQPGGTQVTVPAASASAPGVSIVPITMRVPLHTQPGDHVGAIVASLKTTGTNSSGQQVVLYQRIGTRVFVQVAGALHSSLAVTGLGATYQGTANPFGTGQVVLNYRVHNTGNTDLAVRLSGSVTSLFGEARQEAGGRIGLLLPGGTVDEHLVIGGVWPSVHLAAAVTATPTALVAGAPHLVAVVGHRGVWALPWPLIILVVVLAAAVVVRRRLRRRRRVQSDAPPPTRSERVPVDA